jgi:transcriptional regulator
MYQSPHFREERLAAQHALIRAHPLGLLISGGPEGLMANLVPFLLDDTASPLGTLRCHLTRANPQWRTLAAADEVLVVFTAADAYVSPSWYPSKREHGRVVPTWNYATVQARGHPRLVEDKAWLKAQVSALTDTQEAQQPQPWSVEDAPAVFIEAQLRGIVGVEIEILRIQGKVKASQNKPEADRIGVVEGLEAQGGGATHMARFMREGGDE